MTRECRTCHVEQDIEQFYLTRHKTRETQCKSCKLARKRQLRNDPATREAQKHMRRMWNIKQLYGLSQEQFYKMLEDQNGKCGACGDLLHFESASGPHVDHDHASGDVRGLLCGACNLALGHLKEDVERILNLAAYMEARS